MTREPPPRGFPPSEFQRRLARAQDLMAEARLDAMLLTTEPEVRYFSGFLTRFWQSPTRPWFLVVPRDGKPIAVIPEIGQPLMASTWLDDIRTWPSPRPGDEGVTELVAALRGIGAAGGRLGVPMGPASSLRMPLSDYRRLAAALGETRFVDCSPVVRELRMTKSEAEIAKIAYACTVASDAFAGVPDIARSGQPLVETFRRFKVALLESGADDVDYLVGAAAPGGYSDVISPPDERPLQDGDVLMMDTGALYDGYYCDFDRNYAIGRADDETRSAHDTLYRATEAGLAATRPGASCSDLFEAMRLVIEADGHDCGNVGRFGHGLGMQLTEWPSLAPDDHTPIRAGMVLTLEPGLGIGPGRMMVHEENLVVREDGPQLLSRRAPAELPMIG